MPGVPSDGTRSTAVIQGAAWGRIAACAPKQALLLAVSMRCTLQRIHYSGIPFHLNRFFICRQTAQPPFSRGQH